MGVNLTRGGYMMSDGNLILVKNSFTRKFDRELKALGRRSIAHMRTLRFSVVTLQGGSLVIRHGFNDDFLNGSKSIQPDSQFWDCHVRDRTTQLDWIERRLSNHPMARYVREDIAAERKHLERKS